MRKLIVALLLVLMFAIPVFGQTLHQGQIFTFEWDAEVAYGTITYRTYIREVSSPTEIFMEEISGTSYTVDLATYGAGVYIVGVSTVQYVSGEEVVETEINWSDVNGVYTPSPFELGYFTPVSDKPRNLRLVVP